MADGARIGDRAALGSIIRDIPYARENARFGLGDLYLPERVTPETPVVLTIHGGGWSAGDRYSWSGVAEFFCRELGCVSFNIEYRLASAANRWPACGDDCVKAANWLFTDDFRKHAGFSPKKIYICGGSAGGHLTLWTLVNMPPEKVAAAISISSIGEPEIDFSVHAGRYKALFGKSCGKEELSRMNPIHRIKSGGVPLLCTHTTEDKVVPIGSHKAFADAYRVAGNICEFFEYPTTIQDGLSGHCIWIPNSKPHRLIPEIEEKIKEFMKRVNRGLPGVATKPNTRFTIDGDAVHMIP
jgi:acetyl esterase/lipase